MPKLVAESGQFQGAEYPLASAPVVLGRLPQNDIQVNDNKASRRHTRLQPQGADWFVEDLQSSNGTYLNGKKLAGPMALRDGDKISIGTTIYRFVLVGTATGPPPPKVPLAPAATRTVPAPAAAPRPPAPPPVPVPGPARPAPAPARPPLDAATPPTAQIPLGRAPPAAVPKPVPAPPSLRPAPAP
ncbi:MAG: FHA domain-containing protein, partial [Planctomycetales bacterium]|nr:FHA domain-containing protein [Planctomycetales bacterium]